MDGINSERPVSRRYVQGPRMGRRLERDYPRVLEARAQAEAECAVLIRGLGSLVELEPSQFEADAAAHG